jgi:hypothetical protein
MEGLFRQFGIFSQLGQLYQPEDANQLMYYREDRGGQILQEGINEPGAMSSWIAAATSYSTSDTPMIPFYIYYSMFGFQRVGDLAWASGDSRSRGFLMGGTAGRTTLAGEGLQHQDGHSHVFSSVIPNCVSYDPTFAYELAVIVHDGLRRMFAEQEDIFYYVTLMNENYEHPAMPDGAEDGIRKGMYLLRAGTGGKRVARGKPRVQLLGSGTILREVLTAAELLALPLSRIKHVSGPHLHRSWLNVPHVTHSDEADITELDAYRKELDAAARAEGYRVTLLAFLLKAAVSALKQFPEVNSSLAPDKTSLVLKRYYHLGVAVDTPDGLVVPVLRDVDRKGITELSRELGEVSAKARAGKLSPTDMQGGTFTISSLGGIGGTDFTPIVNAPEVAILGVVRSRMAPVWDGEAFVPRLLLPLSLSYDHRVIDGALAARFVRHLCGVLEDVRRLVL